MPILVLDKDQFSKLGNAVPIERIANDNYIKQAEESNKKIRLKINEYAQAYENAANYFVK
ncbi:MAG: hypothetical protein P4L59_08170 [Desulfosporosinus sp.]|nr:hypothetical protein [Desulfosporosinus sp.]